MKDPIRCFAGNAKPGEPFWQITNAAGDAPEVSFDGPISEYVLLENDSLARMTDLFKADLYAAGKGGPVTVRVNSPGGDVFAASGLRAIMLDYPGEITTRVDSICASAATYLLTAGKTTLMLDTAFVMIHDPALVVMFAMIDIQTAGYMLDTLKTFKDGISAAYETRTGLSKDRLAKMMTDTTWMSARNAVALGFADSIITGKPAPKAITQNLINNLGAYNGSIPAAVLNMAVPQVDEVFERAVSTLRDTITLHNMQKESL